MDVRGTEAHRRILTSRLRKLVGAPALHFAAAGAFCFFLSSAVGPGDTGTAVTSPQARRIVVDATRIRGLRRDYKLANHATAGEEETRALVENLVMEEILFREALAMGFERADRSIGWRLVQKMRYLGEDSGEDIQALYERALAMGLHKSDPVVRRILVEKLRLIVGHTGPPPSDEQLRRWFDAHQRQYGQAARVTFRHVFFDKGRRGADGAKQAADEAALQVVDHGAEIASAVRGDPFVMGSDLPAQGKNDLMKLFGPKFAEEVPSLPEKKWSGPVESTYGWHVVWIEKKFDPRVPELSEVRTQVEKNLEASRREEKVVEYLARVRPAYTIEIDEAAVRGDENG